MQTVIDQRFNGVAQALGEVAFERLQKSHVCVIGLGGVGSWVVEGLARSGVGALTLVDLDDVCISNVNRQIQALEDTVGRSKASVLAERVMAINPACSVTVQRSFFTKSSADKILGTSFSLVIDAIDRVENKMELIAACVERDLALITVGSGGDRLDPLAVSVSDLAFTLYDPLLQCVRKQLRQKHCFPRGDKKRFSIPCVYAPKQRGPRVKSCSDDSPSRKSCNDGLGSVVFMTATMGFIAVAEAVKLLSAELAVARYPWKNKAWYQERIQSPKSER
jgi:tRNA A37 threonylcarbamoyladenosine dehydratase